MIVVAFGWTTAAEPTSQFNEAGVTGIGTVTTTVMGIMTATMDLGKVR